jgi:hypothetical protein
VPSTIKKQQIMWSSEEREVLEFKAAEAVHYQEGFESASAENLY